MRGWLSCAIARASRSKRFGEIRRSSLDGDVASQTGIVGAIHFAHPARANRRDDLIGTEPRASRQGHASERFYSSGR